MNRPTLGTADPATMTREEIAAELAHLDAATFVDAWAPAEASAYYERVDALMDRAIGEGWL